ncbi:MAG: hypothetical protein DRO43_01125 [Candidatus Hecatellales archaeon]|nr:MAG: hypothetical protein DRO43_01125 [Candidatus Hecatellales archaeon]
MHFKRYALSVLIVFLLVAASLQIAYAMPQAYSEQVRLQAVEKDVYAELVFQGDALKLAGEFTPKDFPVLTQVSLWAVNGSPPDTLVWTDLPSLPSGVTLMVTVSLQADEKDVSSQLSALTKKIEAVFPVKFFDVTDLWLVGFGSKDLKVFYSPVDFSSYLKAYSAYIPAEYGGFAKLADSSLYESSSFSMLGVEFYGGFSQIKIRLVHKAEASAYQLKYLKAGVRDSFSYNGYVEPSPFSEASTVEIKVPGGVVSDVLIPNLTVKPGGVLEGNFNGVERFPDVYAVYSPGFQSQPYLKVTKVVDRTTWNQGDLVKVTIYISNIGEGEALNISVDDSKGFSRVADYVSIYEGEPLAVISSLSPGSTEELSYTLLVEELPPEKYVSLDAAEVTYADESLLNFYEASSNSLTVGIGLPIASVISVMEVDSFSVEGGGTVNASISLVNLGETAASNVRVIVQAGGEWLTQEVPEIAPLSTSTVSISTKIYGTNPTYSLDSAVFVSFFSKDVPEVGSLSISVTPNSAVIHLASRNLPSIKLEKTVDKKVCKVEDLVNVKLSVTVEKVLPETGLTLYEVLPKGAAYQSGGFSQLPATPSLVKSEIQPSKLGEPSTLTYTVKVDKPEVLLFPPTLALLKASPDAPPLSFYAENAPVASASLSLTKSPELSVEEGAVHVTVSALNQASISISNVKIEDSLPGGVELVEGKLSAYTPTLGPGEALTLTYTVKLTSYSPSIVFPGAKGSYNLLFLAFEQSSEEAELKVPAPKVTLEKTFAVQSPLAGEPVEVAVRFANNSDFPVFNVKVSDSLPEGFELKNGNLTAEAPTLEPGGELSLNYVISTASDGSFKLPKVQAEYSYLGLSFKSNFTPAEKLVLGPKIYVSKTVNPPGVSSGEPFTVNVVIKNLGKNLEALNVKVSDVIPLYAELVEGSPQIVISKIPPGSVKTVTYKLIVREEGSFALPQPTVAYSFQGGEKVTVKPVEKVMATVTGLAPTPSTPSTVIFSLLPYIAAIIAVAAAAAFMLIKRRRKTKVEEEEFLS